MELRPGYKQTEAGVIPEDWREHTIGEMIEFEGGSQPDKSYFRPSWKNGYVRLIQIRDYKTDKYETYVPTHLARRFCTENDIMIGRYGPPVFQILRGLDGAYNVALIKAKPGPGINCSYAYYFLKKDKLFSFIEKLSQRSSGQTGVDLKELRQYPLPLPPTKVEQEAIAEALCDTDALIESLEQLISKKRHLKQGAMQELLTGKKRLPGYSGEWEVKRLGDVLKFQVGFPFSSAYFNEKGQGIKLVKNRDLKSDDQIFHYSGKFDPAFLVQDGDVLVGMDGDFLPCLWSKGTALLNQRVGRIVPIEGLDGVFAFYFIIEPLKEIENVTSCTTVKHLSHGDIEGIEKLLPPVEEQTAIATILSDMDAEITTLETKLAKTRQIKQGMMHNLLTGRIRLIKPTIATMQLHASNSTECPAAPKLDKPHTWAFNEAVVISVLADQFAKPDFPLGRKRYTKLSYLMHRMAEQAADGYLKKAAVPYNPKTKYAGPERIALENGYIREHQNGKFRGFVAAEKIEQAKAYFTKWYGVNIGAWLEQFRRRSNDDLERLATVDMAMQDLLRQGKVVDVASVRALIASEPEWLPKLERTVFSDAGIAAAIDECRTVFGN